MEEKHNIITLRNGVRLAHLQVPHSEIVHCGFMIGAGSRDEDEVNNGVAHFIEHTVFKGTNKRRSHHILRRMENVGGELNAYTTREKTCYYVSCLKKHASRAVDLLSDITFHSTFPEAELEKEKKVITEEIDMYEDSPEDSVYDDFYSMLFDNSPLGYNILGTKDTVAALNKHILQDFITNNYTADRIVLSLVGNLGAKQAEQLANRYLNDINLVPTTENVREAPAVVPAFHKEVQKDFAQSHCIIGSRAYSRKDPRRYALSLVNNLLGGAGMSSRLNMAVREKHGLVYHIGSHFSAYQDAGVQSVYFATDGKNLKRCQDLVMKELKKLREIKFSERQVHMAKQQLLGQMAMLVENNSVHMQHQARGVLDYGRIISFKEFMEGVEKVSAEEILEVSREIFDPAAQSILVYLQEKE